MTATDPALSILTADLQAALRDPDPDVGAVTLLRIPSFAKGTSSFPVVDGIVDRRWDDWTPDETHRVWLHSDRPQEPMTDDEQAALYGIPADHPDRPMCAPCRAGNCRHCIYRRTVRSRIHKRYRTARADFSRMYLWRLRHARITWRTRRAVRRMVRTGNPNRTWTVRSVIRGRPRTGPVN